eukprot:5443446-Pyramimonas_sp.AAC.1
MPGQPSWSWSCLVPFMPAWSSHHPAWFCLVPPSPPSPFPFNLSLWISDWAHASGRRIADEEEKGERGETSQQGG